MKLLLFYAPIVAIEGIFILSLLAPRVNLSGSWLHYLTSERFYLFLLCILFLWGRWPILAYNVELNADESQVLTQALTLLSDPRYWWSVDGNTIGPSTVTF